MAKSVAPQGAPNEPDRSFADAAHKVRWAEQAINTVTSWTNQLLESYQQSGFRGFDHETQSLGMGNRRVPAAIALATGDAVFNLRSALDCCWMGLKRAIDKDASKGTLPRAQTLDELKRTLRNATVEETFKGADKFILETIRPYKAGNEVLWFGGQVDNWNKHNMLVVAAHSINATNAVLKSAAGTTVIFKNVHIKDAGPSVIGFEGAATLHLQNDSDISVEIVLISRKPVDERPLVPFLSALLKETDEAVKLFVSTFGKKA